MYRQFKLILNIEERNPNLLGNLFSVTFEDKRKQNFDKGQAELERRRQMLQEQMRREEAARQEKERKEQELRDRQR